MSLGISDGDYRLIRRVFPGSDHSWKGSGNYLVPAYIQFTASREGRLSGSQSGVATDGFLAGCCRMICTTGHAHDGTFVAVQRPSCSIILGARRGHSRGAAENAGQERLLALRARIAINDLG